MNWSPMFDGVVAAVPMWNIRERVGVGVVRHQSDIGVANSIVTWPNIWTSFRADALRVL